MFGSQVDPVSVVVRERERGEKEHLASWKERVAAFVVARTCVFAHSPDCLIACSRISVLVQSLTPSFIAHSGWSLG